MVFSVTPNDLRSCKSTILRVFRWASNKEWRSDSVWDVIVYTVHCPGA
jgi:hypothetical protein